MVLSYVFGDSIGQGIFLQDTTGRYRRSPKNCVELLRESGLPIESRAIMGCTVEKGLGYFRDMETLPGSNCVIEFGGNDCDLDWQAVSDDPSSFHDGRVPLDTFRVTLDAFVQEARHRRLTPILITPPPILSQRYFQWISRGKNAENILCYLGDVEHISRWQERYAIAVRETARRAGCRLLDLRAGCLEERDLPSLFSQDGIHPNEQGYAMIARFILETLKEDTLRAAGSD